LLILNVKFTWLQPISFFNKDELELTVLMWQMYFSVNCSCYITEKTDETQHAYIATWHLFLTMCYNFVTCTIDLWRIRTVNSTICVSTHSIFAWQFVDLFLIDRKTSRKKSYEIFNRFFRDIWHKILPKLSSWHITWYK
jgi:hypothetical protein